MSAAGGDVTVLTEPARGEGDHHWPEFLPGGDAVLFTIDGPGGEENSQIAVLDLRTNTQKVLVRGGSHAQYLSTGHLVYGTGGTLRAVAFDLARLEVTGTPVPVLERVVTTTNGAVDAAVAANGTLVYVAGTGASPGTLGTLAWLDRTGAVKPLTDRQAMYRAPRISPDGSRVAVAILAPDGNERHLGDRRGTRNADSADIRSDE